MPHKLPTPKIIEKSGERMITVRLMFWTDSLPTGDGAWTGARTSKKILPKHAFPAGAVIFESNDAHDIQGTKDPVPFNDLSELVPKLLQEAKKQGVVFVPLGKSEFVKWRDYLEAGLQSLDGK